MPRIAKGGIDTKRLVAEIRKLPVLWDPSHEQYPSGGIRKMAWRKVSSILYNDFYLMDVTKQKKLLKELKTKWSDIRNRHRMRYESALRPPTKVNKRESVGIVHDSLNFLLPTYPVNNEYPDKTNLEHSGENNDPSPKHYLVIEVQDELPEQGSRTEALNDTEIVVNDTSQDATINSTVNDINFAVTKTKINKEVFDNDLDINETVIKHFAVTKTKINKEVFDNDLDINETVIKQEITDDMKSSVNKLSNTQQLNFLCSQVSIS
ncbi:Alcohol dehydrogenase transcription factor Myb/SANT-like [Popillia japonica]|uniref:Alcohol dehydrogenase transcription factor Myb/SANT-like n=1 Tax=Popillia japonica TaxID=7064 RepID=A0AAW1N441_POPJA